MTEAVGAHDIPAALATDTAEFRNPNNHLSAETPNTLDYGFLVASVSSITARTVAYATLCADGASPSLRPAGR